MAFPSFDLQDLSEHAQHRLGRQLDALTRDVGHISQSLGRAGFDARTDLGHMAQHIAEGAMHQGGEVAKLVGHQALEAGKAIRKDPLPTVMAVTALACLLSLVMSRNNHRPTLH